MTFDPNNGARHESDINEMKLQVEARLSFIDSNTIVFLMSNSVFRRGRCWRRTYFGKNFYRWQDYTGGEGLKDVFGRRWLDGNRCLHLPFPTYLS